MQFSYIFQFLFALQQICRGAVIISKTLLEAGYINQLYCFITSFFSVRLGTENKSINYTPAFSQ